MGRREKIKEHLRDEDDAAGIKDYILIGACIFGTVLLMISTFVPYWRTDNIGTTPIEMGWSFVGFKSRHYGVLQVKGMSSQSWGTLSNNVCHHRNVQALKSAGTALWALGTGDFLKCASGQKCGAGVTAHLAVRCTAYQSMQRISNALLGITFFCVLMGIAGSLAILLMKKQTAGGIVFGLFACSGLLSLSLNIAWAVTTDSAFKSLAQTAWYPYPSLAAAYYLNLTGGLLILIAACLYGAYVMPDVYSYDPAEEKLEKAKGKIDKRRRKREDAIKQQIAALNFPQPPGCEQWNGYGQDGQYYGQQGQYYGGQYDQGQYYGQNGQYQQQGQYYAGGQYQQGYGQGQQYYQGQQAQNPFTSAEYQAGQPYQGGVAPTPYGQQQQDFGIGAPGGGAPVQIANAQGMQGDFGLPGGRRSAAPPNGQQYQWPAACGQTPVAANPMPAPANPHPVMPLPPPGAAGLAAPMPRSDDFGAPLPPSNDFGLQTGQGVQLASGPMNTATGNGDFGLPRPGN
eukprot:TRINITY_DN72471_c0_g1_i1.p1 TRINITY_DN72471_c0_g1~~TRINITY_DN72471_c0_g1_i1.p1  ORF type:complete len:548 (-),score=87.31 TRINITY_DN72471_c0_g1_i1:292-1827(-)